MQGRRNIFALAKELDGPPRLLYRRQMRLQGPVKPMLARSKLVPKANSKPAGPSDVARC